MARPATGAKAAAKAKVSLATFKQYRETDGKFYFKLVDADGTLMLQSPGFDSPKEPGQIIALLKRQDPGSLKQIAGWWRSDKEALQVFQDLAAAGN